VIGDGMVMMMMMAIDGGAGDCQWGWGLRGLRKKNLFHDASEGSSVNGRAGNAPAPASGRGGKVSGFSRQNRGKGMENPGLGGCSRPRTVGKSLLTLTLG
jgi:hypothetical protein